VGRVQSVAGTSILTRAGGSTWVGCTTMPSALTLPKAKTLLDVRRLGQDHRARRCQGGLSHSESTRGAGSVRVCQCCMGVRARARVCARWIAAVRLASEIA